MDNLTANKNHIPCQSWTGQNGWSTASTQGSLLNPLQESNQSCVSDLSTLPSRNNAHHSALYKASHISSSPSSNTLFVNSAIPSASHITSFSQQTPHPSSMLLTENQGKIIPPPPLPLTNQSPQPCRHQYLPPPSGHNPYKMPFQLPLTSQSLPNGFLPISQSSCGQHVSTSQATFEGASVEFAGVAGCTHSHASSTSQEQSQWIPSSHCRGAVNESVPDSAVHPKKKPSQEEQTSLPACDERQRLLLLHQRAQLLQQVAELDKILESIPPKDSQDGKTPHTATQLKLHLSSDCLSSASQQSEACGTPEYPVSAAVSVKEKDASDESEDDSDPDYLPNSDGDFSDFLSDCDVASSDEPSHNSPSTPIDKKPPQPEKRKANSSNSLFKDKSASLPKRIRGANQKKSLETVVLPSLNSTARRVYNRRNYCLFCSRPVSKMARHLETIHSDKTEVAAAFQYPKASRERQKIWNRLINQGNFAHNKAVLKTGKGELVVRKRPSITQKAQDFLHCLYCRGLYMKKNLPRHLKSCPERAEKKNESDIGKMRIASRCVLETVGDLGLSDGFRNVLSQMTYDDVTRAIMEDEVILQFGELLFSQQGSDPKTHDYIRQNLRQIARLVLEAQKITPLEKLEDFFLPSNFSHVVSAVNVVAGYNPENQTYSIPSLAVKLGYHLQKTCSIVEGNAVKSGDASLAESARNFLSVYQKKWNKLISSGALSALRKIKQKKAEKKMPFAQDVKRLNFHMENVHLAAEKKLRDSPSAENYAALAKVILARTILFNRRSSGEISSMKLTDFISRKKSNSHDGMDVSVSDLEKTMCGFFTRIDIRGKCGRKVPVLLKPSFLSAMELLVELREKCGVSSHNSFLFARPHARTAYNASMCIQKYVKECGAKDPEALTTINIRKHYGTMLQLMNLDENVADQILGPNNQVQSLRQDSGMQLDDDEMDSAERGHQAASWDHHEHPVACYGPADDYHGQAYGATASTNMTAPPKPGKKGSEYKGKHKWEETEVLAVERHMMHLIEEHKVPQKNDCVQCLEAEPEALRSRSWKGVKDYVRNRITALKRQSGSSQLNHLTVNGLGEWTHSRVLDMFKQL